VVHTQDLLDLLCDPAIALGDDAATGHELGLGLKVLSSQGALEPVAHLSQLELQLDSAVLMGPCAAPLDALLSTSALAAVTV